MDVVKVIRQSGLVDEKKLAQAVEFQKETGSHLFYVLCKMRFINDTELVSALSKSFECECEKLDNFVPKPELFSKFPREFLETNLVVPLYQELGTLYVGVVNPADLDLLDEVRLIAGEKVEAVVVSPLKARETIEGFFVPAASVSGSDKLKKPQKSHVSAREKLNELVQELEDEAANADTAESVPASGGHDELYVYETRELLFSLIKVLNRKGLVALEDIIEAAGKGRD